MEPIALTEVVAAVAGVLVGFLLWLLARGPNPDESEGDSARELFEQGRLGESEALLQAKLRAVERRYGGRRHLRVAELLHGLGNVWGERSRPAKALAFHREALGIEEGILGSDHPEVGLTLFELPWFCMDRGLVEDADACCRRARAIAVKAFGPGTPEVAYCLVLQGDVHAAGGEFGQAEIVLGQAVEILAHAMGPLSPDLLPALSALGRVHCRLARWAEASSVLERALRVSENADGEPGTVRQELLESLRDAYRHLGRARDVELVTARLAEERATPCPTESPSTEPVQRDGGRREH